MIQVKLSLPWKISTFIHYIVTTDTNLPSVSTSPLPHIVDENPSTGEPKPRSSGYEDIETVQNSAKNDRDSENQKNLPSCTVQVYMEGDYDTMQEIIRQVHPGR